MNAEIITSEEINVMIANTPGKMLDEKKENRKKSENLIFQLMESDGRFHCKEWKI